MEEIESFSAQKDDWGSSMKIVEWKDKDGYERSRMIKEGDPDELAAFGKPLEPPDLERLDWNELKRALYHELKARGLYSWQDVQRSQNGVTSAILTVFRKKVIDLYREV